MGKVRNILFIMADQLRWDYLSCYGHPHLKTLNIDGLAKKGVQFESAFVQSPVCGPSRASYYTGRTVFSHGSTWNQVPLPIGELTIGDYLRQSGIRTGVVGKTHMRPDLDGMSRLGITKDTEIGLIVSEPGFDPYERDDGLHPNNQIKNSKKTLSYNEWLNKLGYDGPNPWNDWANSAEGENGEILSGWRLRNSNKAARIPRVKKPKTSDVQVKNLKYKVEDIDAKLMSVNPVMIPGKEVLFVYNTKTRKLTQYNSNSTKGFEVSGTTIKNIGDESRVTTLRKPDDILPLILSKTIKQIDKQVWDTLTTKVSVPNGRINGDCILLRVL